MNPASSNQKLFSIQAIDLATFFGGPLAAGIMFRQNAIRLGKGDQGHWILLIGLLFQIGVFGFLLMLDEETQEKIPAFGFPFLYTLVIHLAGEQLQGSELKAHKENHSPFFSRWKAFGIGSFVAFVTILALFGVVFFQTDPAEERFFSYEKEFIRNEEKSMAFYDHLHNSEDKILADFILTTYLPAWQANLGLTKNIRSEESWNPETDRLMENLEIYSEKRIEMAQSFLKSYKAGDDHFFEEMKFVQWEIDSLLNLIQR